MQQGPSTSLIQTLRHREAVAETTGAIFVRLGGPGEPRAAAGLARRKQLDRMVMAEPPRANASARANHPHKQEILGPPLRLILFVRQEHGGSLAGMASA
jgi:hypothetical protein